ncbi:MAG TPA: biopolymer transporter ExbD [Polyangia bacterium]|jgi:biopolymer transport protein TolR|nr:biopolymer transporter ExbD [Polyangia bacterium]
MASISEDEGGGDDEGGMISGINVTPLVDITLVLLIIFMVTATYIVRQAIHIDLPRAANAGESTGVTMAIILTKDGDIYVDGKKRDEAGLRDEARQALAKDKDTRAIISADKNALHGSVVRVLDLIKGEGVSKFAINIEKER